ncbi:Alkyl hydroperoxide reductase and/or thiol-specific antioxidant family (AhpC/TSA) protein [Lunatimonas lonarensis]|uniref:Alkyl hydroperoxide reductase and/or thiol-specific antioxidant family (AhpC/TSA) protein n=1 Tax=Lunatimonas lonarensis TaxID=1232681 RepID=R7ZWM6_9BACT|nr:thioredoxin family protein [Lunatimonas lonarensis]EON78423.1 Alkyl hydroperoxide reductase and/or thiol-specific antioxidant family (AhpC/TSA) protein [Lunatimonas lonarensis]
MNKLPLLLAALLVTLVGLSTSFAQQGYQVGDKAIDFDLPTVNGERVSLKNHSDAKGFLVVFSCNTCPYVVAYEDRMIELHNKFAPMGYPLIAINPNDPKISPGDSFEKMQERAKKKGFPFSYAFDETQEITRAYGATNTPQVYLLEKSGNEYIVRYIGAIDNNYQDESAVTKRYVEDAVSALLTGGTVPEERTRAIGCTIKWRKL